MASDNPPIGTTVAETAASLGVSKASVYRAIARGVFPAYRLGRRLVVPVAALERLLTTPGAPSPVRRVDGCGRPGSGVPGLPPSLR